MHILVTGANGFIGRNLVHELRNKTDHNIYTYDLESDQEELIKYVKSAEFVYYLAGVNRPEIETEYMEGNCESLRTLLSLLEQEKKTCPIMLASSIQAELDNPYGKSKRAAEELLFEYKEKTGAQVFVYRLPNVFGKWCRPNYNSVIATFCHNIARNQKIVVNDRSSVLSLAYIDDVIEELVRCLYNEDHRIDNYCFIPLGFKKSLGEIEDLLYSFYKSRENKTIPDMKDPFVKRLYSTYISYIPEDNFSYPLNMNIDERGSFTEIIRTSDRGQFSVNISKPGIIKGNHWHHTKNEKFLVVSGKAVIRFRRLDSENIHEYFVSGDKLEVIDIPVGYTHNIENIGNTDLITFMWCNECFDPLKPDTHYLEV